MSREIDSPGAVNARFIATRTFLAEIRWFRAAARGEGGGVPGLCRDEMTQGRMFCSIFFFGPALWAFLPPAASCIHCR